MNQDAPMKIAISIGDLAGIGSEVVIKSLANRELVESCIPIIYANNGFIMEVCNKLGVQDFQIHKIEAPFEAEQGKVNVLQSWEETAEVDFGSPSEQSGQYALKSLEQAVQDLSNAKVDALVTAPIDKHNIQSERFQFPGHTEYLASVADAEDYLMLLVSGSLRVGVVTGHIPISSIPAELNSDRILKKVKVIHHSLQQDFGISSPKIAVLGLNPHAGDNGLIGKEEKTIILPAIDAARNEGIDVRGPLPADGLFGSSGYKEFHAILGMYHDQGLIPFKALSFGSGVNFTAGLPFVRTSPDHGTAFDIAGKGVADESSFREALTAAVDIVRKRRALGS